MIVLSLETLAASATAQRASDFPPEDFRISWGESFVVLTGEEANPDALASFDSAELSALTEFGEWLWSLPPEPDPMWHRGNLDASPWPEIRARASELLELLGAG